MSGWLHRFLSPRIRELERELARVSSDLQAMNDGEFDKVSIASMTYTPESGLQATFEGSVAHILAGWAFNTLEACKAQNYVEFSVIHKKAGAIRITVQRALGESPATKAERLERELAALTDKQNP